MNPARIKFEEVSSVCDRCGCLLTEEEIHFYVTADGVMLEFCRECFVEID